MARDYKYTTRRRRRRSGPSGWAWLLAGLFIGLFVAFLYYLQSTPGTEPDHDLALRLPLPSDRETRPEKRPEKRPEVPDTPPAPKPRFDFYTLLPEMEVVVPEREITGAPRQGVAQVEKPGTYVLQVGSFRDAKKADQLKARLALLGFESSIQTAKISNGETWHRVRAGPFSDLAELNAARAQLRKNELEAVLLKRQ